jgi:NTE family protein
MEIENNIEISENNSIIKLTKNIDIPKRKIKHIVVSGGSIWGFCAFGIIFEAIECGFLNIHDVESIYGTSIGAVVGLLYALKIDPNIIKEYIVNRPWESVCKKSMCAFFEIFEKKGFVQKVFFEDFFSPLLKSIDLDINITMRDLYNFNGIEFHVFVTELNSFKLIDISYKTHPNWHVIDAIFSSCTIPFMFSPIIEDGNCYLDGGFFLNYPISKCIENVENRDEILGISLGNNNSDTDNSINIHSGSNIFEFLNILLNRIINNIDFFSNDKTIRIPYEFHYYSQVTTIEYCINVLCNKKERNTLLNNGMNAMKKKCKEWFCEIP